MKTMNLGSLIRRYRKEKKRTLKAVAERAGLSEGFVSQVENNVKSPSVETLVHICDAIEINAGDLLNQLKNQERLFMIRRSEWEEQDVPHTGFATRRFCPPEDRAEIDSAMIFLQPGKSIPVRKGLKNGQEVLCVLKGALELVHGETHVILDEGDSAHVWSDPERQSITNVGAAPAVMLWVGTL
jgi:transcriptional regulator with XRE-family HTH domain